MTDSLKVVKKNFIVAFKYNLNGFIGFLPLIFIGYLIFKNGHYDILNGMQILSSFASVSIVYSIVDSLMAKENKAKISIVMKKPSFETRKHRDWFLFVFCCDYS